MSLLSVLSASLPRLLAGVSFGAMVIAAQASEFSVGRVEIVFAEDGWSELQLPDSAHAYSGDRDGAISVQLKLYVRKAMNGMAPVYALVSANSHGFGGGRSGQMSYSGDCKSNKELYRDGNSGYNLPYFQCLTVAPRYTTDSLVQTFVPQMKSLRDSGAIAMPDTVYTVWSRHAISTGAFVDVRVFTSAPITVDESTENIRLPEGVPPAHVAWGRKLRDSVKSSVYSLSGRLTIPPIRTTPPAPSGPTSQG